MIERILEKAGNEYQEESDQMMETIINEFPEFSWMDSLYIRNFIQENGIPIEIGIKNIKKNPIYYVDRIRYTDVLGRCYFPYDKDLEVVKRLLKQGEEIEIYIEESLKNNKPLWKVIKNKVNKLDEETIEYLSREE